VTVLRDGHKVGTHPIGKVTSEQLVEMMVGGAVSDLYAERTAGPGEPLLRVEGLSRYGFFHRASFQLHEGEILGICGLAGAGRSELVRSLCGIDPLDEGAVFLRDREITPEDYSEAIRSGLAYLTEDRKACGLALRMTLSENVLSSVIPRHCSFGMYLARRGRGVVSDLISTLNVLPPETDREAATFSGGNQQKILLAKWLATDPEVLILDEPTRGVDVGAKAVIHKAVAAAADRGKGVILISSDLPELVGLSDRILVMCQGHLTGELAGDDRTEEKALLAANRGTSQ
jgi:ribose transport system ATP-binding protein